MLKHFLFPAGFLLLASLATHAPLHAEQRERINKYLELKKDLLTYYAEPLALSELARFKNGGMAWSRDIDFFGRVSLDLRGRNSAALVHGMGLQNFLHHLMQRQIPDVSYVDIVSPSANATLDFERMGYIDITLWALADNTNVSYYIDAVAGKEKLQHGQGGPWYEFVLGSVPSERLQCALQRDISAIVRQFSRDFNAVRNQAPVDFDGIIPFNTNGSSAAPQNNTSQ